MHLRLGFEMVFQCPQPTPILLGLNIHPSRQPDLVRHDWLVTDPVVPIEIYRDSFDNVCGRVVAPAGRFSITTDAVIRDSGNGDPVALDAPQVPVEALPSDVIIFLLGSRYCETDRLSATAWDLFGNGPTGWARVQAVCDYVHQHIRFGYEHARRTRTAFEAWQEGVGVCRDYTHLAVALCRCLNIPARYCSGYITDIGIEPAPTAPMDFAAWFEAWLGDRWYVFDPRNNDRRIGRTVMTRGRDAIDCALTNTFGSNVLERFVVWADEDKPAA